MRNNNAVEKSLENRRRGGNCDVRRGHTVRYCTVLDCIAHCMPHPFLNVKIAHARHR